MRLAAAHPPPRALILAAGRGERMRPLTDTCPKPLLAVHGRPLLQWWVDALTQGGVAEIVINTAWLGEKIEDYFGRQRTPDKREQLSNQELKTAPAGAAARPPAGRQNPVPMPTPQPPRLWRWPPITPPIDRLTPTGAA